MNNRSQKIYRADLHGHSIYSDGSNTPSDIVAAAIRNQVQIIALSDHDSIKGWSEFLTTADKLSTTEYPLLAIPALEVTSASGDLLVTIPDRRLAEKFQNDYRPPKVRPPTQEIIEEYVTNYQALCILLHPEFKYIRGIEMAAIDTLIENLTPQVRKNVGIEIYNWMAHISLLRDGTEAALLKRNQTWQLAALGNTDYHLAKHIGNGYTEVTLPELTAQNFMVAFQNRQTTPDLKPSNFQTGFQRTHAIIAAERNTRGRNMYKPAKPESP